jgi:hypothetical protein
MKIKLDGKIQLDASRANPWADEFTYSLYSARLATSSVLSPGGLRKTFLRRRV